MREFSEPLMRRLVKMDFKLLDASDVAELLRRRFDKQTADLLAEIYRATVEAGLRKPATVQELTQLGHVLNKMPNAPLDRLLKMFVIKYDDDWERFKEYLERKAQKAAERRKEQILRTIEQQQILRTIEQQQTAQQETAPRAEEQLLSKISPETRLAGAGGGAPSGETYTFKAHMSDDVYTAIAKMYPPGDTPEELGKFRVVEVNGERVIVAKEPLSIQEFFELNNKTSSGFEAYIEDKVRLVLPDDLESLIRTADTVKSYSRRAVHLASKLDDVEEEVLIELSAEPYTQSGQAKLVEATVKARVAAYGVEDRWAKRSPPPLLEKLHDAIRLFCRRRLTYRDGVDRVAADITSMCLKSNTSPDIVIEGDGLNDSTVDEIKKTLAERIQPLGLSVENKCEGGRYTEINIYKLGRFAEVVIECRQ